MTTKRKLNVLVVEDQELLRDAIIDEISFAGCNVYSAREGEEGLELYKNNHIDLIFSDIFMPNKDGYWLLCELRKIHKSKPHFIFMTGFSNLSLPEAYAFGADGFLTKPFNLNNIEQILKKAQLPLEKRLAEPIIEKPHYRIKEDPISFTDDQKTKIHFARNGMRIELKEPEMEIQKLVSFQLNFSNAPFRKLDGIGRILWKQSGTVSESYEYGIYFEHLAPECIPDWIQFIQSSDFLEVVPGPSH